MTGVDEKLAKSFLKTLRVEIDEAGDEFMDYPVGWLKENLCTPDYLFGGDSDAEKGWLKDEINRRKATRKKLRDEKTRALENGEDFEKEDELRECEEDCKIYDSKDAEELSYVLLISGVIKEFKRYEIFDRTRRRIDNNDESLTEKCCVNCVSQSKCCLYNSNDDLKLQCHPIWILDALVSEEHLQKLEKDPLRAALKLRSVIREDFNEHTSPYMYSDMCQERLREVPRIFAESLMNECVSPEETGLLMNLEDKTVLFDLQAGKFGNLVHRPAYKKLYQERIFWEAPVYESFKWSTLASLRRFFLLIFWNVVYPFLELLKCIFSSHPKCFKPFWLNQRRLFSPISCFTADMVNYVIMIILIAVCMLQVQPSQDSTVELAKQFLKGNISVEDHPRFEAGSTEGVVLIELEKRETTLTGWTLFACLLSRIFTELYQLFNKRIWSAVPDHLRKIRPWKKFVKKVLLYWESDMNKIDILLMGFLMTAQGIEFHYSYSSHFVYGKICVSDEGCGDNFDYTLESRRITYMTNSYSVALLLSLVRLFHCAFLFVPIIGPILLSIQRMVKDVVKVLIILIFFSVGFFVPLFAIIQCYIYVHEASNSISSAVNQSQSEASGDADDTDTFETMKSAGDGFVTMILSIMEGKLTYSEDIYKSKDPSTTIFFFFIMFFYFLIFGLLCVNLLIALISKRYDTMTENKNRDWRFCQFDLLVDYLNLDMDQNQQLKCNDGMPFFFPFSLIYVPCRLVKKFFCSHCCSGKNKQKEDAGDIEMKKVPGHGYKQIKEDVETGNKKHIPDEDMADQRKENKDKMTREEVIRRVVRRRKKREEAQAKKNSEKEEEEEDKDKEKKRDSEYTAEVSEE